MSRFFVYSAIGVVCAGIIVVRFYGVPVPALDVGSDVLLEGMVMREPTYSQKSQRLLVAVPHNGVNTRVQVFTNFFPEYAYGDVVQIAGALKKPEAFITDAGTMFDYAGYLAKDGVYYQMLFPDIVIVRRGEGNAIRRALYSARRSFVDTIARFMHEPDASLVSGITIGATDGLDEKTEDAFRRAGLIHIVVLSGYNITVLADTVMRLLAFLPRVAMLSGGGAVVVLFVIATGATATSVRAGTMAVLALMARGFGRRYNIHRALFLTALGMVLWNPRILVHDPSFQLSFLATFGLITLSPLLERLLCRIPSVFSLRETVSATIATQLFTLPLIMRMSGQVSVVSLLANILVLPAVPLAMFAGGVLGSFGGTPFLGTLLSFPTTFVARYIIDVALLVAHIPMAAVTVPPPPLWCVALLYGALLVFIRVLQQTNRPPISN